MERTAGSLLFMTRKMIKVLQWRAQISLKWKEKHLVQKNKNQILEKERKWSEVGKERERA